MNLTGALFINDYGKGLIHDNCPHLYKAWTNVPVTYVKDYWVNGWGAAWMSLSPGVTSSGDITHTDDHPPRTDASGGYMVVYDEYNKMYFKESYNLPRLVGDTLYSTGWTMNYSSGHVEVKDYATQELEFTGQVQHYPFYIRKLKAFLPEIPGVGAPLTVSMNITDSGRYAIDLIDRVIGGWNVYISSAPKFYLYREANSPLYYHSYRSTWVDRYVNQKIYNIVPGSIGLTGVSVSGYAGYSSAMATSDNTGMVVKNVDGADIFRFPSIYTPITPKSSGEIVPSVPVFSSIPTNKRSSDVIFFGVSQRRDTYDNGLVSYNENAQSTHWRYDCRTIWSRQFIDKDGVVYSIPVSNDFTGGQTVYVPGSSGLVFGLGSYGSTVTTYNCNTNSSGGRVSGGEHEVVVWV
jgi:hypothetical protein